MATSHSYSALSGSCPFEESGFEVKDYKELSDIGGHTHNKFLLWQIDISMHIQHCFFREYKEVYDCGTKYRLGETKRPMELIRLFYEGISALVLARQTQQPNYRVVGEQAIETFKFWVQNYSRWNFENKLLLLEAELHCLNDDLEQAVTAYTAAINSANQHKFIHEEALSLELYGVFLVENKLLDAGYAQLEIALQKYLDWGAFRKADALRKFMKVISPEELREIGVETCFRQ
jgi:hypothetical protein